MATAFKFNPKKKTVIFNCPHCNLELHCPYDEAGTQQQCPECRGTSVVPGATEVARLKQQEQQLAMQAAREKAEAQERARQQAVRQQQLARSAAVPNGNGHSRTSGGPFLAGDERIVTILGDLVLTTRKLIKHQGPFLRNSVILPLRDINFVAVKNSRVLGVVLLLLGLMGILGSIGSMVDGGNVDGVGVFGCLISLGFVVVGVLLMRRRSFVFSASGGTMSFSFLIGSVVGMSYNGIQSTFNCDDTTAENFLQLFFEHQQSQ